MPSVDNSCLPPEKEQRSFTAKLSDVLGSAIHYIVNNPGKALTLMLSGQVLGGDTFRHPKLNPHLITGELIHQPSSTGRVGLAMWHPNNVNPIKAIDTQINSRNTAIKSITNMLDRTDIHLPENSPSLAPLSAKKLTILKESLTYLFKNNCLNVSNLESLLRPSTKSRLHLTFKLFLLTQLDKKSC